MLQPGLHFPQILAENLSQPGRGGGADHAPQIFKPFKIPPQYFIGQSAMFFYSKKKTPLESTFLYNGYAGMVYIY